MASKGLCGEKWKAFWEWSRQEEIKAGPLVSPEEKSCCIVLVLFCSRDPSDAIRTAVGSNQPDESFDSTGIEVFDLQDWSLKQALQFVSGQRPQISPNAGFMASLIQLEESLHGTKTVKASPKATCSPRTCLCHPCRRAPLPSYRKDGWMLRQCLLFCVSIIACHVALRSHAHKCMIGPCAIGLPEE